MQTIAPARSGHPRALLAVLLAAPILVPWVAAFGLGEQITGRLPGRLAPVLPHVSEDGGRRTGIAKPRRSGDLMTAASQGSNS
jgi:hypothetical protein